MSRAGEGGFGILVVCTGNICRSPIGEVLLRARLDEQLGDRHPFVISSAGTYPGHHGDLMQPHAVTALRERGADPADFRATALDASALASAELVLTAEAEHRDACARMLTEAAGRSFTMKEFAGLVDVVVASDPEILDLPLAERARALVARADAHRRTGWPAGPVVRGDGIDDPYLQPLDAFRRTADEIDAALTPLLRALTYAAEPRRPAP